MILPRKALLPALLLTLAATSARAHHPMGGATPQTLADGLLSGLGHPVIGLDHLAFVLAAGVLAAVAGLPAVLPLVFVAASLAGVGLHLMLLDLPAVEIVIALSVVAGGVLLALARGFDKRAAAALFALVGLFHGYAYGEAIVGAEETALLAYLAGLGLVQAALALGAFALARREGWLPASLQPRMLGAAVFGVGLTAIVGQIVG